MECYAFGGFFLDSIMNLFCLFQALDLDEGINSQVLYSVYHIQPHFPNTFVIDNTTGVVRLTRALDYEQLTHSGQIQLEIQACDQGQPPMCSNINVTIDVEVSACFKEDSSYS
jgi:hypothetical protein